METNGLQWSTVKYPQPGTDTKLYYDSQSNQYTVEKYWVLSKASYCRPLQWSPFHGPVYQAPLSVLRLTSDYGLGFSILWFLVSSTSTCFPRTRLAKVIHSITIKLINVTLITVENMINIKKKKSQCPLKDGSPNTDQHWQILNQPSFIALLFLCLNPSPSSFPKINPKWIYGGNYIECIRNSLHMPQFTFPFQPSQCL